MKNQRNRIHRLEDEVKPAEILRVIVVNPLPGPGGKPVPGRPNAKMFEFPMPKQRKSR